MLDPEIGFWGGMALLVSSITGPGLTTGRIPPPPKPPVALSQCAVPLIFQQSGWLLYVPPFVQL